MVKAARSSCGPTSSQSKRRRDQRTGHRPHRVHRRGRTAVAVLVGVDQHAVPPRALPLGGDQLGRGVCQRPRHRMGEVPHGVLVVAARDRHEHVDPSRSRGLGIALEVEGRAAPCAAAVRRPRPRPPNSVPSAGSRSNITQSGRSGRSARALHAFMSMQPMFTIQAQRVGRVDQRVGPIPSLLRAR